jgi:hypothetical protein
MVLQQTGKAMMRWVSTTRWRETLARSIPTQDDLPLSGGW